MEDMAEYERLGDLAVPFSVSKKAERTQSQASGLHDALRCDVPRLTWEQYSAGEPCPGCSRPYRGDGSWEDKGSMYYTDQEWAMYEEEDALFRQKHGDCHSMRHSTVGALTMHCGRCCPPPPMSPSQATEVARILFGPRRPEELTTWRLRLYCGHIVERRSHYTHKTIQAAFTGSVSCSKCGLHPATIIEGKRSVWSAINRTKRATLGRLRRQSRREPLRDLSSRPGSVSSKRRSSD